jgi:hypothetical protein
MICGVLHGDGPGVPEDEHGCILPVNHGVQPHEYIATDGVTYQWETDLACDCVHCMKCEGDYCTIYWQKPEGKADNAASGSDA